MDAKISPMPCTVKLLCVKVKPEENADTVKTRVLKHLKNVEKVNGTEGGLLGKSDSEYIHVLHDLDADSVLRVVSNSNYIGFLLKDGRVCRMRCASRSDGDLRPSVRHSARPSFQVQSDAEYAKQLQATYNSDEPLSSLLPRGYEELDWMSRGMLPVERASPERDFYLNLTRPPPPDDQDEVVPPTNAHRATPFRRHSSTPRSPPPGYDLLDPNEPATDARGKKKAEKASWPVLGKLEWLVVTQEPDNLGPAVDFVAIAALHSEFLLVDSASRQLYAWPCDPHVMSPGPHALSEALGLCNERIALLESSDVRACVVTESGRVATLYDKLLRDCCSTGPPSLIQSLSHEAREYPEFAKDPVVKVSVSNFITTVITMSGQVYWWGLCPQAPTSDRGSSSNTSPSSLKGSITEGSLVRLKNGPPCGPNAVVFYNCSTSGPCVGRTVSILERTNVDPKSTIMVKTFAPPQMGGAGTSKQTSSMTTRSAARAGSTTTTTTSTSSEQFNDIKLWKVSDVVFLDDSPAILGRAVAIDQQQAVIDISYDPSTHTSSKSSLKVFKLSELEACLEQPGDGADYPPAPPGSAKAKGSKSKKVAGGHTPAVPAPAPATQPSRSATRHVAGIVQHAPINILDSSCSKSSHANGGSSCSSEDDATSLRIYGHRPLDLLSGDEGPTLLVERVSDGKAFLVCSSQASDGPFGSTSFVAVGRGKKDGRPYRCTVEEEGVSSLEAGLVDDRELLSTCRKLWGISQETCEGPESNRHGDAEHRLKGGATPWCHGNLSCGSSLIPLYHSRLLLRDTNGIIQPLTDGLRLRPTPTKGACQLSCPYSSVTSRQHSITSDTNVLLFVLIPKKTFLMPHVLAGNVSQVEAILKQLHHQVTRDDVTGLQTDGELMSCNGHNTTSPHSSPTRDGSKRHHSESTHDGVPSKRLKVDLTTSDGPHLFISEEGPRLCHLPSCLPTSDGAIPMTSLLERTAGNASILHVCCQLDPAEEGEGCQATPLAEQDAKFKVYRVPGERTLVRFQSLTCQPPHHHDQSFEELRYRHQTSNPQPPQRAPPPRERLAQRHLSILERLLSCRDIQPVITKLLCSANIEGHTPFMTAVVHRNYAAALRILSFVEANSRSPVGCSPLFRQSILGSASSLDMTPLQLLLSSLTSVYDARTKLLHVSNVPPGFTAQQLLKLFQSRYPAVYKAEVYKAVPHGCTHGSASEDSQSSSSDSDDSGANGLGSWAGVPEDPLTTDHPTSTGRTSRALRRMHQRRHRHRIFFPGVPGGNAHQRGVVHFADITQLRAALREMQDFRVASSLSRATAFGHTASMSVLRVHVSNSSDEEGEGQVTMGHLASSRTEPVVRRKEHQRKTLFGGEFSSYTLALELLNRLISHQEVATSVDCVGETVLASLVHNSYCLAALKDHQHPPKQRGHAPTATGSQSQADSISCLFSRYHSTLFGGHHSLSNDDLGRLYIATQMLNTNNAFVAGQQDSGTTTTHDPVGEFSSLSQDAPSTATHSGDSEAGDTDTDRETLGTEPKQGAHNHGNHLETTIHDVTMGDESVPGPGEAGVAPSNDLLQSLVTNWPCVVSTILGFYVAKQHKQDEGEVPKDAAPVHQLSPVHLLDSFTADLVLNADRATVFTLVATIVERMNAYMDTPMCVQVDAVTFDPEGLKLLTEENQAVFVGKRFLGSVVRVLALEHSRVKNTFAELQQMRDRASSAASGAGGGASGSQGNSRVGGATTVLETLRAILTSFSWLAVYHLAEAAEASNVPVRYGISKPLGASSVSAEYFFNPRGYNSATSAFNFRPPHQGEDPHQAVLRQMHIRRAYLLNEVGVVRNAPLPPDGVHLHPESKEFGNLLDGGDVLQEESFDDLDIESQEIPTNEGAGGGGEPSSSRTGYAGGGYHFHTNALDEAEILIDLDPTSSDEEYVAVPMPTLATMGVAAEQEQSTEEIYPFAWALDGRRIGESESNVRPGSPSVPTFSLFNGPTEPSVALSSIPSIRFGAGFLARTFARIVKDLVDIIVLLTATSRSQSNPAPSIPQPSLKLSRACAHTLLSSSLCTLDHTWKWASAVLDMAEAQLQQGQHFDAQRYVASLRGSGYAQGQRMKIPPRSFVGSTAGEYIVYLLRSQANEDGQCLPVVDLYGYEHVVYVLDSLVYSLAHWPRAACTHLLEQFSSTSPPHTTSPSPDDATTSGNGAEPSTSNEAAEPMGEAATSEPVRFFERTDSVVFRSSEQCEDTHRDNVHFFNTDGTSLDSADIFTPVGPWGSSTESFSGSLSEPCPLAQQPYLLRPNARREDLFKSPQNSKKRPSRDASKMSRTLPHSIVQGEPGSSAMNSVIHSWSVDQVLQRWHLSIGVFAHIFLAEGPGGERSNFLNARAGFASRMAKFRQQVGQLFEASQVSRDWASSVSSTFSVTVRRDSLVQDALEVLQQMVRFHFSQIRVKFEGEDGSGPGVNRGFFAALANAIKSSDQTKLPMSKVGVFFHEPGKLPEQGGFYTPSPFLPPRSNSAAKNASVKMQRANAFRAIGRYFGLCFWFRYTVPFMMCRHVAKYLLGRDLAWHDLAFYNVDLYEGMRRMMLDAQEGTKSKEEFLSAYCCYFEAPIASESGPILVELITGGSKIPVTPDRVQEYVRLYATFVMVGSIKDELEAMRQGLTDVIPAELLSGLTAEDFQLLLSGGSANITLSRLRSVIRFNHTHNNTPSLCELFERMFWKVVSGMNNTQRQQLLYFATGTAALPATSDGGETVPPVTPPPPHAAISITIDVIGSGNTDALPVASTCSQRMSIPLYPSYHILKKKLLQAIQCQAYGLG